MSPPAPFPEEGRPPTRFRQLVATYETRRVRAWAVAHGLQLPTTGGLPRFVYEAYAAHHPAPDEETTRSGPPPGYRPP